MSLVVPDYLYHGSAEVFRHVDVGKGRPYKDFGKGFYMSVDRAQAIGMMHKKFGELTSRHLDATEAHYQESLYRLSLDRAVVSELRIRIFGLADESWLNFILACRQSDGIAHDYDVIVGPTADDDTRLLLKNFVDGVYGDPDDPVSKATLLRLLKPERLGVQWFVGKQSVADRLIASIELIDWRDCL